MKVGLFIPCYIDQFFPQVGMASLRVLEHFGAEVDFPEQQTCCGQPMANAGCFQDARSLAERFVSVFADYQYVVCPSGSCVSMVKNHYGELLGDVDDYTALRSRVFELCEFLVDVCSVQQLPGRYAHRVGLHQACHGLRELRLAASSERMELAVNKPRMLLESIDGLELVELERVDECCGFGGTFAVDEEAVSTRMGMDRLHDHSSAGAEVLTSPDMSCLMHLEGLIRRNNFAITVKHIAEIFSEVL